VSTAERIEAIIDNAGGQSPVLLVCEHASAFLPDVYAGLGLDEKLLADHVAWDIGAYDLALLMAERLDAALIAAPVSRLLIDVNRHHDAHDLIPVSAEGAPVPGNLDLAEEKRARRIAAYHAPFHDAIEAHLQSAPHIHAIVSVHSFTPTLFGKARPWHAGLLHDDDRFIADIMIDALVAENDLVIGRNEPYAPTDGVFYTMNRHARAHASAMIEVRNDLIADSVGQMRWANRLAPALDAALAALSAQKNPASAAGKRS
jgi:predicted N-formylglutamate amidohydrolase